MWLQMSEGGDKHSPMDCCLAVRPGTLAAHREQIPERFESHARTGLDPGPD